jgi:hypothetical protein
MNLIDATITKVGKPYKKTYDHGTYWMVDVEYTSYGRDSEGTQIYSSKEKAEELDIGDTIQV